jgi:hypothetical protein
VLVACTQSSPCAATPQVTTPGGVTLASAAAQTIGADEVGYLHFRMNATGHAQLHRARLRGNNQVPARISISSTTDGGLVAGPSASALVSLSVF